VIGEDAIFKSMYKKYEKKYGIKNNLIGQNISHVTT
jgi:hypothetical protein